MENNDDLDYDEKGDKHPAILIIGGVVSIVVIIIICVVVWNLTHEGRQGDIPLDDSQMIGEEQSADEWNMVNNSQSTEEEDVNMDSNINMDMGSQDADLSVNHRVDGGTAGGMQQGDVSGYSDDDRPAGNEITMSFSEVSDTVTAKELTNLRSEPSTERPDTVVVQLKNGETVDRTGINNVTGWSRLDYNGQTVYAVSQYLTTDLTPKDANSMQAESGNVGNPSTSANGNVVITSEERKIYFTPCDDIVSPKIRVNLRSEPSTAQGNGTIHYGLEYGETVRRTGYDESSGWSRVEYNGEVLYAVTSYLYVVEEVAD